MSSVPILACLASQSLSQVVIQSQVLVIVHSIGIFSSILLLFLHICQYWLVCYVIYYMCVGAITFSVVVVAGPSNFYDPSQHGFALDGVTKGGAPTSFTWRRDGVALTSSSPYTIATPVLASSENACSERFYRSRVTVTGKVTGVFTYTVTNADTGNDVMGTLDIERMNYYNVLVG